MLSVISLAVIWLGALMRCFATVGGPWWMDAGVTARDDGLDEGVVALPN